MKSSRRRTVKRLAPVVTAALVAGAGLTVAVTSGGSASAASPALKLVVPVATQNIQRWKDEPIDLYGLGYYAVADKTIELRTHRDASYKGAITTTLSIGDGADKVTTTLPDNITSNPATLTKFLDITVTDAAGKTVKKTTTNFCPNSYSRSRVRPDAPAESPYPQQCGEHPFALGNVMGITGGWSTPVFGDYFSPARFDGADGAYTMTTTVTAPWRKALGLSTDQATSKINLNVTTVDDNGWGTAAKNDMSGMDMKDMQDMPGMHMATGEHLSPQHEAEEKARQQALGKPNVPAATKPAGQKMAPAAAAADNLPKPDLRSLPAYQIKLDKQKQSTYLTFGATVWNAGTSPLVVDGFRGEGADVLDAYQYFFNKDGKQVGYTPAGQMQWDGRTGHNHWHFKAFASYRLLDSDQKNPVISGKEAFCLAPTDAIDLTVKNSNWRPASTDLYTACGQGDQNLLSIREVLDVGWGDTYSQSLPGQSFDITNVANGTYYIQTIANPDRMLTEADYDNNSALRKVDIGGTVGGKRTIKVYPVEGIKG